MDFGGIRVGGRTKNENKAVKGKSNIQQQTQKEKLPPYETEGPQQSHDSHERTRRYESHETVSLSVHTVYEHNKIRLSQLEKM